MPLFKGSSDSVVSQNIKELMNSGRKQSQAVAIALQKAGKGKNAKSASKKVVKSNPMAIKAGK